MKELMKKHILHNYSVDASLVKDIACKQGSTYLTHSIENSDPDVFSLSKQGLQNSNNRRLNAGGVNVEYTKQTFVLETSDEDDFLYI